MKKELAWEGIAEQGGLWKRRQRDSVEESAEKLNPRGDKNRDLRWWAKSSRKFMAHRMVVVLD